jgi:hypothetical protein
MIAPQTAEVVRLELERPALDALLAQVAEIEAQIKAVAS